MKLISCNSCGVILDSDKLYFPDDINLEDGSIDINLAAWDGDDYIPKISCPVCSSDILEE